MNNPGGFRGFADFASPSFAATSGSTTSAATLAAARAAKQKQQEKNDERGNSNINPGGRGSKTRSNIRPSPIYTGSDARLIVLFRKIGQKRDPATKSRALEDLVSAVFPSKDEIDQTKEKGETDGNAIANTEEFSRPEKIASLCHLVFLHETKLGYDNNASVRSGSYKALAAAKCHVPKAWNGLFLVEKGSDNCDATEGPEPRLATASTTVGMAWSASKGDPAGEVARSALAFVNEVISAEQENGGEESPSDSKMNEAISDNETIPPGEGVQMAVLQYSKSILRCKRASSLQEVINPVTTPTILSGAISGNNIGGGKAHGKSKKNKQSSESSTSTSEADREEIEERYERVVLSVLRGLGWLVSCCPEVNDTTDTYASIQSFPYSENQCFPEASSIVRLMQSSRGSFRREAFALGGKLCQFARSIVLSGQAGDASPESQDDNMLPLGTLIPSVLSAERDPTIFASLMEMILTYIAAFRDPWKHLDPSLFTKSLSKTVRRACYGAPAIGWGPTILPIVASLPRLDVATEPSHDATEREERMKGIEVRPLPLLAVESLWDGHKSAVGVSDTAAIVSAVIECVTFLMLRRPKENHPQFSYDCWRKCGQLLLESLVYFLMEAPDFGYGPAAASLDGLCTTLSRDILKLDTASCEKGIGDRGVSNIANWLWGQDGLQSALFRGKNDSQKVRKLGCLLKSILIQCNEADGMKPKSLIPAFVNFFHVIILSSVDRSNKSCTGDEVQLLLNIMQICGVDDFFPVRGKVKSSEDEMVTISTEHFCVNDLLRWILVHSSIATTAIETDFEILKKCIQSMPSFNRQKQVWETLLRELIKSFCDFTTLAVGLSTMTKKNDNDKNKESFKSSHADLVRCAVLDSFATETCDQMMSSYRQSHHLLQDYDSVESSPKRKGNLLLFITTCLGMHNSSYKSLVSTSVIKHWINSCLVINSDESHLEEKLILEDEAGSNYFLKALLILASLPGCELISTEEVLNLIFESWFEGGTIWNDYAVNLLTTFGENASFKDQFISKASSSLRNDIHCEPPLDHAVLELTCQAWSKRAMRLLRIANLDNLDILGLGSAELWDSASLSTERDFSEYFFLCLMYLLHSFDSAEQRKELISNANESRIFVHILTCIAKSENPILESFNYRTERNHQLLDILGGQAGIGETLLEQNCIDGIDLLSTCMNDQARKKTKSMINAITSLSFLVSALFQTPTYYEIQPTEKDEIEPSDVKEGDSLWYELGSQRIQATVIKIHTDDFPNLYFTIREEKSNSEKQTVASRLKRHPKSFNPQSTASFVDGGEDSRREYIGRLITDKILKPHLFRLQFDEESTIINEVSAEAVNIILSQCGLISVGIGSVRYEIFQGITSMLVLLCDSLAPTDSSLQKCTMVLRCLSLALGFGVYTIPSSMNITGIKIDPTDSIVKLVDFYSNSTWFEAQKRHPFERFHQSVSMWLSVAVIAIKDGEIFRCMSGIIRSISNILLSIDSTESGVNVYVVMKAMYSFLIASNDWIDDSTDNQDEKQVLDELTQRFIRLSQQEMSWKIVEAFSSLLAINSKKSIKMLEPAARSHANDLTECLYCPSKRWCSFHLLYSLAMSSKPLQEEDSVIISDVIQQQQAEWKQGMDGEDALELEDDIIISASWLPEKAMCILSQMKPKSSSIQNSLGEENEIMGDLLTWLTCLSILDTAGSVDMRNRTSISSFIQKTKSLGFLLETAIKHADLDIDRKESIFSCTDLDDKHDFSIQEVATLAVFRTVESLPTLVKTWFNDYCPRYMQNKLSTFVENRVAPETLHRELTRIKKATSFGEMTVNGSCVSREITATYHQDECQLSVMIRIPPSFPLKNVEVDCQKTLGIPENRWRRWALQIMLMLNNQDGSVLDALLLWKQNVDKEFDGVEPCPVCYSVLCIKTHAMPNLQCRTCNNRFHSTCLHKWFTESGKSNCVLCQQPWSGTKV